MKIFRHRQNRQLYTISLSKPAKVLGSEYQAYPIHGEPKKIVLRNEADIEKKFEHVSDKHGNFNQLLKYPF